jgi:hypothetical protein
MTGPGDAHAFARARGLPLPVTTADRYALEQIRLLDQVAGLLTDIRDRPPAAAPRPAGGAVPDPAAAGGPVAVPLREPVLPPAPPPPEPPASSTPPAKRAPRTTTPKTTKKRATRPLDGS